VRRRTATAALVGGGLVLAAATLAATRPDPRTDAVADGCERNPSGLYTSESPNWAYVNDRNAPADGPAPPPQWVRGEASARYDPWLAAHPAGGDNPFTHRSFDLLTNIRPDPAYDFLLGGDPEAEIGNFEGSGEGSDRLHTEWETGAVARFAWPERGDRIEMLGSWVWDCDHFLGGGERTELHPARALIVHRNPGGPSPTSPYGESETDVFVSTDKTPAGTQADCAHRAKGDRARFKECVRADGNWQDVSGRYRFFVAAPPRPAAGASMQVRVVERGSVNAVPIELQRAARGVWVTFAIAAQAGRKLVLAKQVFVGWSPMPARALPQHLRVRFRRLIVRRAMDPGCPAGQPACGSAQTTLTRQISAPPGEWVVYWNVDGIWGLWDPVVLRPRDGQVFRGRQTVDLYVPRGKPWRLFMFARECDFGQISAAGPVPMTPCPRSNEFGDAPGDETAGSLERRFRSPAASLGRHLVDAKLEASTCPLVNRRGCYAVEFTVTRIADERRRAGTRRIPSARIR
jgi:hypothetical protein